MEIGKARREAWQWAEALWAEAGDGQNGSRGCCELNLGVARNSPAAGLGTGSVGNLRDNPVSPGPYTQPGIIKGEKRCCWAGGGEGERTKCTRAASEAVMLMNQIST